MEVKAGVEPAASRALRAGALPLSYITEHPPLPAPRYAPRRCFRRARQGGLTSLARCRCVRRRIRFGRARARAGLDVASVGVIGRIRTDTIRVHGPGLCWLSYDHHRAGCPGRFRTSSRRVNSAPLHRLSYWTKSVGEARDIGLAPRRNWYRPTDSNRAPLAYRASALPAELDRHGRGAWIRTRDLSLQRRAFCWLNYAPTEWCFPSVSSGALRGFNPALSPDQLEKRGAPGLDSNGPPPAY